MSIDKMKEHYDNAGKYYDAAKNAPNERLKQQYQRQGDEEYAKGSKEAENEKKEINNKACNEASQYYDKGCDARNKGDYKTSKECIEKGDKIMADAKTKEKEIDKAQEKSSSEARSKMDGLERTRY